MKTVKSVCPYCGVGCGIELQVKDGKVIKVLAQKDHPINSGKLCIKGANLEKIINSPKRLKYPMIKTKNGFKRISWSKAFDIISKKIKEIKKTYGDSSIGIITSTKCTNEESYLIQKFARVVLGNNNIDNATRLCHATTLAGLYEILGKSAMTNTYNDLREADVILVFGDNPVCTQPIGFQKIMEFKKHGGKLVVIDVRKTETAEQADIFLQINPNTDVDLIAGFMKIILEKNLEDKDFIKKRTRGYKKLLNSLEKFDLKTISKKTGISIKRIREVALLYGRAKKAAILYGMGITQQLNGIEKVMAIADLAVLTGNIGRPGTGVNPLRGCNNVQGVCDMGCLSNIYPGYSYMNEDTLKKFKKLWKVRKLPINEGLKETEMIEAIPEKILGLYIIGADPLMVLPNINRIEENLKNLQFLVVQDIFMTETAKYADIILPAACFAEKTGTVTNSERRIQLYNKAAKPPGKALADWIIIKKIAEKMGYKKQFNYRSPKQIFDEIKKAVHIYSGVTYKKLKSKEIFWPCDKKHPTGKRILYDKDFGPPGNKAIFYPLSSLDFDEKNKTYNFVLTTHRLLEHYNSGSMTMNVNILKKTKPEPYIEINESDAKKLKIKNNDKVKVESPADYIVIKTKVTKDIKRGVVAVPNHFSSAKVNKLIGNVLDPISKTPMFKYCRVKIEKI